jgi:NAD+ kinase
MRIGLFPNISKVDVDLIINRIISDIKSNGLEYVLSDNLLPFKEKFPAELTKAEFYSPEELGNNCEMVISIGGDGTMLHTAHAVRNSSTPILGVNFGKLGFLAEFDLESLSSFLKDVKEKNYIVEERMALSGSCSECCDQLYAINDLVIDKGPWTKMIELTILVDDVYVTTFSADGIIIATPTGSTGYSLSAGGPIVNPNADVITLSPIAPHSLTMRSLVISSRHKITIKVDSLHEKIQISSDGQRVNFYEPPAEIYIEKSSKPVRLVHSNSTNYFEILRKKLFWGMDVRKTNNE